MNSIRFNGYNCRMASITITTHTESHPNLRPMSMFRDLPAVADLIEMCFSNTMDNEGKRYVQDMRRAGSDHSFLKWANHTAESTSLPLTGYVWEENGRIVGNASLVPFRQNKQRIYLIANVAVHSEYRRRGIARTLTERALKHARDKNADIIWLHVRDDNPNAVDLYTKLGFLERARRTTWQAYTDEQAPTLQSDISITTRHPNYWTTQLNWLNRLYPDLLAWHRNWNFNTLRPGFWNWLYLMFMDLNIRQWAAVRGDSLQATLTWIPYGRGEALFAATDEGSEQEALVALLLQARRELSRFHPNIILEFPTGKFDGAIQSAGFRALRTLIWMQAT
jgi:ribosomal protein S18 acetylase RimI-like enzyme